VGLVSFPVELNAQDVRSKPGCIYNCLNEKTKGWLAGKLPGMDELSTIIECKECMTGLRNGKPLGVGEQTTQCIKCINGLVTEIPGIGELIEAGKCVYDCQDCSAANPDQCPEEWTCVDGRYCWCSKSGSDFWSKADKVFGDLVGQPTVTCRSCKDGQWGRSESYHCAASEVCHDHPPGDANCEDKGYKCNWKGLPPD
jgi:hypothetical protein